MTSTTNASTRASSRKQRHTVKIDPQEDKENAISTPPSPSPVIIDGETAPKKTPKSSTRGFPMIKLSNAPVRLQKRSAPSILRKKRTLDGDDDPTTPSPSNANKRFLFETPISTVRFGGEEEDDDHDDDEVASNSSASVSASTAFHRARLLMLSADSKRFKHRDSSDSASSSSSTSSPFRLELAHGIVLEQRFPKVQKLHLYIPCRQNGMEIPHRNYNFVFTIEDLAIMLKARDDIIASLDLTDNPLFAGYACRLPNERYITVEYGTPARVSFRKWYVAFNAQKTPRGYVRSAGRPGIFLNKECAVRFLDALNTSEFANCFPSLKGYIPVCDRPGHNRSLCRTCDTAAAGVLPFELDDDGGLIEVSFYKIYDKTCFMIIFVLKLIMRASRVICSYH